jgi:hypothetical protein
MIKDEDESTDTKREQIWASFIADRESRKKSLDDSVNNNDPNDEYNSVHVQSIKNYD